MENQTDRPPNWKIILAALLDFFTMFMAGGYLVGNLTGSMTEDGFDLSGGPAILLIALIVAYFVIGNRFFRGTLWKHILGTARQKV